MPKRSGIKRPIDFNQRALQIVREATGEEPKQEPPKKSPHAIALGRIEDERRTGRKNPHAIALGRLGGRKGGRARAANLTPEQRSEIARKAARARWKKQEIES